MKKCTVKGFGICFLILFISCSHKILPSYNILIDEVENTKRLYEVYKIDSVNNYYLIYLKNDNGRYKVVSKMGYRMFGEKIRIGGKYCLTLSSIRPTHLTIEGKQVALPLNVDCFSIDEITTVCIERNDSIYNIYDSKDLHGLYIVK